MERLPGWVTDNRASVDREAEPYRGLSPAERFRHMALACRGAARQLASRPDRERVLAHRDPLPPSSIAALERLRAIYRTRE